jgi:hypothetical protein
MRPRFAAASPSLRTEGAGKAGCRLHPRSCAKKTHEWTTGSTGSFRLSPREWFTAYFVFSPVSRALLPPSPCGSQMHPGPGRVDASPQDLTPASGVRTIRLRRPRPSPPKVSPDLVPSGEFRRRWAAAPSVRAPVDRSRKIPPCNPVCARHCRVHRIPPRVRDDSRSAPCRVRRANL